MTYPQASPNGAAGSSWKLYVDAEHPIKTERISRFECDYLSKQVAEGTHINFFPTKQDSFRIFTESIQTLYY